MVHKLVPYVPQHSARSIELDSQQCEIEYVIYYM